MESVFSFYSSLTGLQGMWNYPHYTDKGAEAKENDSVSVMLQNPTIFSHHTTCCWHFLNVVGKNWMPNMRQEFSDIQEI